MSGTEPTGDDLAVAAAVRVAVTGIEFDLERIARIPGVCHVSVRAFDRDPSIVSPDDSIFGDTVELGPPGEVLKLAWLNLAHMAARARTGSLRGNPPAGEEDIQSIRVVAYGCTVVIFTCHSRGEAVEVTVHTGHKSLKSMHRTVERAWKGRPQRRVLSPSGSTDPRRVPLAHKVRDVASEPSRVDTRREPQGEPT